MSLHHFLIRILVPVAALGLLMACSRSSEQSDPIAEVEDKMDALVSVEWLSQHLDDPDLVVVDCTVMVEADEQGGLRMVNGRANYESGHIPTAAFADLMGNLSDADSPLEFAMPPPEQFVAAMSALGVSDESRVVLYDAQYSAWAARVWWMLRWIGFDRVALLDGGLAEELALRREELRAEFDDRLQHLDHCMEKLPEKQRALVDGYYFHQHSVATLAGQAQRTTDAVYKALQRIRRQLRECIERSTQKEASS